MLQMPRRVWIQRLRNIDLALSQMQQTGASSGFGGAF